MMEEQAGFREGRGCTDQILDLVDQISLCGVYSSTYGVRTLAWCLIRVVMRQLAEKMIEKDGEIS